MSKFNTVQEMADAISTHLFAQGRRAMSGDHCAYRGDDGTSCAVGCLIPDNLYTPKIETRNVYDIRQNYPEIAKELSLGDVDRHDLLAFMQDVHDKPSNWQSTDSMRSCLSGIYTRMGLDPSILATLSFKDR